MKIEVGKSYRNGYGDVVKITARDSLADRYPFHGVWDGEEVTYTGGGVFDLNKPKGLASLVAEVAGVARVSPAAPTFSAAQVSRILDALNLARNGCSDTAWAKALVALEEALCPKEEGDPT